MIKMSVVMVTASAWLLSACVLPVYDDGYYEDSHRYQRSSPKRAHHYDGGVKKPHKHPGNSAFGHAQGRGPHR